jgi:hypothetical protein
LAVLGLVVWVEFPQLKCGKEKTKKSRPYTLFILDLEFQHLENEECTGRFVEQRNHIPNSRVKLRNP